MMSPPPLSRQLPALFQRSTNLTHLLQIHSLILKTSLDHHHHFATQLISSLSPLSIHHARSVFDHLSFSPSLFAWNSLIRGYAKSPHPLEAIRLFSKLRRVGSAPDNFTYPFVLKACARSSIMGEGGMVHCLVVKTGFATDSYVGNTLLHMYATCGAIGFARRVFDEMIEIDVVSWSAMIEGYVACDRPLEAVIVFRQMRLANVEPNSITLLSLLSACSHLASLSMGQSVHSYITIKKIKLDVALGTALVEMYAKCGHIEEAFQVFNSMEAKNLQTWTIMISGFADHGHGEDAISLFTQMESSGIKPDSMSFSSILCACSHLGLVDEGLAYFSRMVSVYNIQPTMEHYGCMVDMFGRAGLIETAQEFMRNMPVKPNSVILRSFLGACRKHGKISRVDGKLMKLLLKEEPSLGANYVLAANVSALSGHWSDAARLRGSMLKMSLKKVPGCSWVEAKGGNAYCISKESA